ncbi:unnamed protein product [Cylindrotheca closterium]|uniref:WW domain-containing protein n=1 Tax=Cylindrotheca closterium TaxID=2856 RepID=A0AAD2JNX3_9STRA|nr:unnamed protein product [Cylindrotheca closterium]
MSKVNNEDGTEVSKRDRPEDSEDTAEQTTKKAKVEESKDEAEAKDAPNDEEKKEEANSEKNGEGAEEKTETVKEEDPTPAPAPAPVPQPAAYAPAVVAAPAGLPAPTQQSYALPSVADNQVIEERGEISALYVGRVIGKGGEMIRDLQARSACRIDVDQNVPPGQPRVITYQGTKKTVDFAKHLVYLLCQDNGSEADLPLGEAKREYLVVPASSVGKIIGRGGEMIRDLQSRSQAKIQVDHTGHSGLDVSEKQVTITGTEVAVRKAVEMVLFLVANPLMDAMQSINMLAEEKLRTGQQWGSGPPYPGLQNQGQNMEPAAGGYGGYDQQQGYGGAQAGAYGGGGGGYGGAAAAAGAGYAGATPAYQQQSSAYGQYGGGGGVEIEMFYAAKNFMGRIIGQKGCTINDLQRRSACDIQINQDVAPGQDCEITIKGSRQGIEMAKQMLREIIEIGPNHPYAGGNYFAGGQQQGGYGGGYQQQSQGGYQQGYGQGGSYGQQQGYQAGGYGGYQASAYGQPQASPYASYGGAPQAAAPVVSDWKSATAPDGQVYYYNQRTGETQWNKPIGMP